MYIADPTARLGEDIASQYLSKKGYKIIERNFRKGYGEIDIIAINQGILVFIEVKTRTTSLFGGAKDAIGKSKLKSLARTAQFYKMLHTDFPDPLRIDAVFIQIDADKNTKNIEHIENITGY